MSSNPEVNVTSGMISEAEIDPSTWGPIHTAYISGEGGHRSPSNVARDLGRAHSAAYFAGRALLGIVEVQGRPNVGQGTLYLTFGPEGSQPMQG